MDAGSQHHEPSRSHSARTHRACQPSVLDGVAHEQNRNEESEILRTANHERLGSNFLRQMNTLFRLRAGDLIQHDGRPCRVIRVTDCAAVVAVDRPPREFTTLFGQRVRIQPKPALVRISPNSEVPILNR